MLEKINEHYSFTAPATVYDEEALTTLELAARTAAKVNEIVDDQNNHRQEVEERNDKHERDVLNEFIIQNEIIDNAVDYTIPNKVKSEFQDNVSNGTFNDMIDAHAGNLESRLDNLLGSVTTGTTTSDAELIDLRVDAMGHAHASAGKAIRSVTKTLFERMEAATQFLSQPVTHVAEMDLLTSITGSVSYGTGWTRVYNVAPGEMYLVTAYYGFNTPDVIFYKDEGEISRVKGYGHTYPGDMTKNCFDKVVVVPEGADQMYVHWANDADDPALIQARLVTGYRIDFSQIEDFLEETAKPFEGLTPVYRAAESSGITNGSVLKLLKNKQFVESVIDSQTANLYNVGSFKVAPGQRVRIKASADFGNLLYVMFNDVMEGHEPSSEVLYYEEAASGDPDTVIEKTIIVPVGVNRIIAARIGSVPVVDIVEGYNGVKPWEHLTCVCVGDSLTEVNDTAPTKYHDYIHEKTGINIVNLGQSGRGVMRGYDSNTNYITKLISYSGAADVIFIMGSGNDNQFMNSSLGELDSTSSNDYCGCFNNLVNLIRGKFPKTLICVASSPAWKGSTPRNEGSGLWKMSETLKKLCERQSIPFLDLYRCSNLDPDSTLHINNYYKIDSTGVHPDSDGHKVLANPICRFLDSVIGVM